MLPGLYRKGKHQISFITQQVFVKSLDDDNKGHGYGATIGQK